MGSWRGEANTLLSALQVHFVPGAKVMLRRVILVFATLVAAAVPATGQFGVYGEYAGTHTSGSDEPATWYRGPVAGVYYNAFHLGPIGLGLDAHGTYSTTSNTQYRDALIGPRLEFNPPILPIRPYAEAEIGVGGAKFNSVSPFATHFSNKLQYGFAGGVDAHILPLLDFRIAEITYVRMTSTSDTSLSPVSIVTLGAGLVLRIP
jgi:hypothetical protein